MLVAALQMGPAGSSIAITTDRILTLVDKAAAAGVTLGVLPELALTPYFAAEIHSDLDPYVQHSRKPGGPGRHHGAGADAQDVAGAALCRADR